MKPAIKDGVSILYRPTADRYELNFLVESSSTILPFEVDAHTLRCIQLFDGTHTIADISATTGVAEGAVNDLAKMLHSQKLLRIHGRSYERYAGTRFATQANFLAGFECDEGTDLQAAIQSAHVTVIGLGGVGSWVAYGLVLAGVKKLTHVDFDVVELSNLNRQCLYDVSSIGLPKADALAHKLTLIEPDLEVVRVRRLVDSPEACVMVAEGADLVICCADEPGTDEVNRLVSATCYPRGIPHILCGGYDGHLGFIGPTIIPGASGCWSCYERTLEHQLRLAGYTHLRITPAQVKGGNLGSISAIIANYHVIEALKVISGFAPPALVNQAAELDFLTYSMHMRAYHACQGCAICGTQSNEVNHERGRSTHP